jgi:hypothetical protein
MRRDAGAILATADTTEPTATMYPPPNVAVYFFEGNASAPDVVENWNGNSASPEITMHLIYPLDSSTASTRHDADPTADLSHRHT